MKVLNGSDLADFIKERQAKQVRSLRQSQNIFPKLAIVASGDNPVNEVYLRLKKQYGEDILVDVEVYRVSDEELMGQIDALNKDKSIHGIIVQLPLSNPSMTDEAVNTINPEKDVDGLSNNSKFIAATPTAIDWLLAGYNIDLNYKKIAIVGEGKLVGAPLARLWQNNGLQVEVYDDTTTELGEKLREAEIIVSATGVPGLIKNDMLSHGIVVVDAGTASEDGVVVGDVDNEVRTRDDLTITPVKGGVGPLTVAALFDNVITAARESKVI